MEMFKNGQKIKSSPECCQTNQHNFARPWYTCERIVLKSAVMTMQNSCKCNHFLTSIAYGIEQLLKEDILNFDS
jgi:hypothetical protein